MSRSNRELEHHAARFEPAGFFVLRAPLLPIEALIPAVDSIDEATARARLRAYFDRPDLREALAIASPSLAARLDEWMLDHESEASQKVEQALMRYFARSATRPTPFGLFAGCAVGTIGEHTSIVLRPSAEFRRHSRLDNGYLDRLAAGLAARPEIRARLRWSPNSSLYELGGQIRYTEAQRSGRGRTYNLVAVEANELVDVASSRARGGATIEEIAAAICAADPEITVEEARGFVDMLIEAQILESSLEPPVTGGEPILALIDALDAAGAEAPAARLREVSRILAEIDGAPLSPQRPRYDAIGRILGELPAEIDEARLFQVDMRVVAETASLREADTRELVEAALILSRYVPRDEERAMRRFCEEFERRYERRDVPLLEALDEDCGIGFDKLREAGNDPEPLLQDIVFAAPMQAGVRGWTAFEEMLRRKLEQLAPGERELKLRAADFDTLAPRDATLPDSFALNVTYAASSADALTRGDYSVLLRSVEGPSGMNWLGRFCHGDPDLETKVRQAISAEEALHPDKVFAEVVHLPEGRLGNVLVRPRLREYEIPYLGRSGAPEDAQLTMDDLVVTVWDGRVVLKSRRLGKEVVPRLTTAHGFTSPRNVGLYRFLCALQTAGQPIRYGWTWAALEPHATFMPRVTFGRVVLALARWSIKSHQLAPLAEADTRAARWSAAQALRERFDLPRHVVLADGDNALPVDFDNPLSVESFVQLVRKRPSVLLTELFPTPGDAWVETPAGRVSHEIVMPFQRRASVARVAASAETSSVPWQHHVAVPETTRLFPPGSEWLYLKLYASPRSCDVALARLAPVLRELRAQGVCDRWFFLRFADAAGWHLRLRLHGEPSRLLAEAMPRLHATAEVLLAERLAFGLQLDTYHREVEHWGGPAAVLVAERILCVDSEAVLDLVEAHHEDPRALGDARWKLALAGVDGLWARLGLDLPARLEVARGVREGLGTEFRVGGMIEHQLSTRFRATRREVDSVLSVSPGSPGPWASALARLRQRDEAMGPLFEEMRALEAEGRLNRPLHALAHRFSHLHVNRILRSMLREQELVLMDFLDRHYRSAIARARKSPARATLTSREDSSRAATP